MRRAALVLALAACANRPPVLVPVAAPRTVASAPPVPVPVPVHACSPPAAPSGRYLSVRARYAVGEHAEVATRCELLSVWTQPYGLRLFDPRTGIMTAPLPADAGRMYDEPLDTGALALWSERSMRAIDRFDLAPRWSIPRTGRGRVFSAGKWVIDETGTEVIARNATTGRERWRRPCPCGYESIDAIDGRLIARLHERGVEAWDESDGRTLWRRPEYVTVVGPYVVSDRTVLDANGKELARLRGAHARVEAMAADGDVFFLATSEASEYGGVASVAIEGIELSSGRRVFGATAQYVVRRYASAPPEIWVRNDRIHYYEVDNGLLTSFERTTGKAVSVLGVGSARLARTPTGFVAVSDEGVVEVIEPSDVESPPMAGVRVEGVLTLDGKPIPNIEIVVGNALTRTGPGGRYAATLDARGRFWVKVKQPTSQTSVAYWSGADTVVEVDGRAETYVANLAAHRDSLE